MTGEERLQRLRDTAIIIDGLGWSYVERASAIVAGRDQIDRALAAGLTASNQYLASHDVDDFDAAIHRFWRVYGLLDVVGERALLVESAEQIPRAKAEGKLGLILGFQGASPIQTDLAYLTIFHKLGLRILGLVYDRRNRLGDGCQEPEDQGLTAFGAVAVHEANRLGVLLDCSHAGERTSLDVIARSAQPVVFTHSNVRALTPHHRNLSDEQIDGIGACGGVIGISSQATFCRRRPGEQPTLADMVDHIDYVAGRIGIDHVAIGTDMVTVDTLSEQIFTATFTRIVAPGFHPDHTGAGRFVRGFEDVDGFAALIRHLLERGYADDDILKILGGNWLRVFRQVWRT